ncbi:MAG: DUF4342 domain-containing protein [Limnochordia bacterium]|jgi:hypothetical protein|nr:DUF4342 domain-containing protein [Bacillota bacterium]
MEELEKIDILRRRADLSYAEAKALLDEAGGDIVQALIKAEGRHSRPMEQWELKGKEALEKVREVVKQGNAVRVRVKREDKVLLDIPLTAGVVGGIIAPKLALVASVLGLLTKCTLEVERKDANLDSEPPH